MDASRHDRLFALFEAAAELPEGQRDEFIERECSGDDELLSELRDLLRLDAMQSEQTIAMGAGIGAAAAALQDTGEPPGITLEPGTRIDDYTLVRSLGVGGVGAVYEAQDERMYRTVAVKVLAPWSLDNEKAVRRFGREAWIAGKLTHPGIVKVYDYGEWEGHPFYAMELVEGGSLADVIGELMRTGRVQSLGLEFGTKAYTDWCLRQTAQVARALHHAHSHGVVHRDIKPLNLLLALDPPQLKIADFGIALADAGTRLTAEGQPIGTLRYMAPEQLTASEEGVDATADIYALGVTLFQLLTLKFPYEGDTLERYMHAVLNEAPRSLRTIRSTAERDLETVVTTALEKSPRDRYGSADLLAADLEAILDLRPIGAKAPTRTDRLVKWARRKPAVAALAAVLLFGIPASAYLGFANYRQAQTIDRAEIESRLETIRALGMEGRNAEIIDEADRILAIDPDNVDGLRSRAAARFNLAYQMDADARESGFDEAFADLKRWHELRPDIAGPLRYMVYELNRFERPEAAEKYEALLENAKQGDPDDLYFRADLALKTKEYQEAVALAHQVILHDQRPDAIYLKARALRWLERFDEAISELRALVAMAPDNHLARSNLGLMYLRKADANSALTAPAIDLDAAGEHLQAAYRMEPAEPVVIQRLAEWYQLQGEAAKAPETKVAFFLKAEALYREGLALAPDRALLHQNLGRSLTERARIESQPPSPELLQEAAHHYGETVRIGRGQNDQARINDGLLNQCDLLILSRQLDLATAVCIAYSDNNPEDPFGYYNLAAVHALSGRADEAFAALERDVEFGDRDYGYLEDDEAFESLRDDPRFERIIDSMKRLAGEKARP